MKRMTARLDIIEQLIDAEATVPAPEVGDVPEQAFGRVSILSRSILTGDILCMIHGEDRPTNIDSVDFGGVAVPEYHPWWVIAGLCRNGSGYGCEICDPTYNDDTPLWANYDDSYDDDYDRYDDGYTDYGYEERTYKQELEDKVVALESRVRNLEWQIKTQRELNLSMRNTLEYYEERWEGYAHDNHRMVDDHLVHAYMSGHELYS